MNNLELVNNTYVAIQDLNINTASITEVNSVLNTNSDINVIGNGASIGINLINASTLLTEENVTISVSNTGVAVKAAKLSKCYFDILDGEGNIDGVVAESGATITVSKIELKANVLYSTATGGSVFVDAQTVLSGF